VLGFVPLMGTVVLMAIWQKTFRWKALINCAGSCVGLLLAYWIAVRFSNFPTFFEKYFAEIANRREGAWRITRAFEARYWGSLLKETHFFLPLALLGIFQLRRSPGLLLPVALFFGFYAIYAPAGHGGGHYWIPLWLGAAWLIAAGCFARLPIQPIKMVRITMGLALFAILVIQYIPVRTHGGEPTETEKSVAQLLRRCRRLRGLGCGCTCVACAHRSA